MKEVIVVGGGIIGTTIAKSLHDRGVECELIDSGNPLGGTRPSGGHLKPSWFGTMPKDEYSVGLDILEDTWGIIRENFRIRPVGKRTELMRVNSDLVMDYPRTEARVKGFDNLDTKFPVIHTTIGTMRCRYLVVCVGAWAHILLPERFGEDRKMQTKQGVSFMVRTKLKNGEGFIKPWSPYKQIVAHQHTRNTVWVGDGSAILKKNWTDERTEDCRRRCLQSLNEISNNSSKATMGIRAYVPHPKNVPCLFEKIGKKARLATGAGKSGTIAAGWVTAKILRELAF